MTKKEQAGQLRPPLKGERAVAKGLRQGVGQAGVAREVQVAAETVARVAAKAEVRERAASVAEKVVARAARINSQPGRLDQTPGTTA